jgi:hypothetical protein
MKFIDVEASGFDDSSYPIQVGWFDSEHLKGNEYLIAPFPSWTHWCEYAQVVHSIPRQSLITLGLDPVEVCHSLNNDLGMDTVYCDALVFDRFWLDRLFQEANINQAFSLASIESLMINKLDEVQEELEHMDRHHTALKDAMSLAALYNRFK